MVIRSVDGIAPSVHETAYVDEDAVVIGDVEIGPQASIWPNTTIRGDRGKITIKEGTNIQDNSVMHEGGEIGPYASVGHCGIVHAATVEERALVAMNAVVLDNCVVGEESIVAAGSVVTEGTEVSPRTMVAGTPAKPVKELEDSPWMATADHYTELAKRYAETSERVDR
jgi:carbonic anhydrase/acetyltransferase-like protein (isoleucine patch superfamily)